MTDENHDQVGHRGDQDEQDQYSPDRHLAPPAPAQSARELAESLDRPGRAEGVYLRFRHVQTVRRVLCPPLRVDLGWLDLSKGERTGWE